MPQKHVYCEVSELKTKRNRALGDICVLKSGGFNFHDGRGVLTDESEDVRKSFAILDVMSVRV